MHQTYRHNFKTCGSARGKTEVRSGVEYDRSNIVKFGVKKMNLHFFHLPKEFKYEYNGKLIGHIVQENSDSAFSCFVTVGLSSPLALPLLNFLNLFVSNKTCRSAGVSG